MIVKVERSQKFWVEVDGREIGVFEHVYIDGEKVSDDWQTAYFDASAVYIDDSGDAVFIYTLAGEMHNVIRALAEVLKHG